MSRLSKWLHKAEKAISNVIPHQHSADRRKANQAAAEEISYYQESKAQMAEAAIQRQEVAEETKKVEAERQIEKKKISQKQIKSMRRSFRAPGFMDEAQSETQDTLG